MDLIVADFETYYAKDYTLSKMNTEEYVRDPRFEALILGVQVNDNQPTYAIGSAQIQTLLDSLDVENHAVLCHHAQFDGLIMNHHFGHTPKVWLDTLSMARALYGVDVGGSLGKLSKHLGVGEKGTEVVQAIGKRLADFTPQEISQYARYCCNDIFLTKQIFLHMLDQFPQGELKIIDMVIRMFTEPGLLLNEQMLLDYAEEIKAEKATALITAGVTLDEVMSNDKFALALQRLGIDPPQKMSLRTGKRAWAFAKTDKEFTDLLEHDDTNVQALVSARLGNKTTINETRAMRMAGMAPRGYAPIYIKYSGARQTHRMSGGDKMNWQNMQRGGTLRNAIYAPDGLEIVVADSSLIEARLTDYTAGQEDAVEVYRKYDRKEGPDTYCVMASALYGFEVVKETHPQERQVGKYVKLSSGYGSGAPRLQETIRIESKKAGNPITVTLDQSQRFIDIYRMRHAMVKLLWSRATDALSLIASGPGSTSGDKFIDPKKLLRIEKGAIVGPNGLKIRYDGLSWNRDSREWTYNDPDGSRVKIYGGKVVQHGMELLARTVVLDQTLAIHKHIPARMSVHDEGVFLVPEGTGREWADYIKSVWSVPPTWAPDLPVACSVGWGKVYGKAKQ